MKSESKKIRNDFIYSFLALVLLNGITQLVIYPFLSKQLGNDAFGTILSLLSIVSIMSCTFGGGTNYSRIVVSMKTENVKGDYNIFFAFFGLLNVPVTLITLYVISDVTIESYIYFYFLILFTTLRYYGDVNYRLSLNYKKYFIYYFLISFGYLIGILTFFIHHNPLIVLIIGEVAGFIYVFGRGDIYKKPYFKRSKHFISNIKSMTTLSLSYMVGSVILNIDRLLILKMVDSLSVTIFYIATLVGKCVALLTNPISSVIIGHLAKSKKQITVRFFQLYSVVILIGSLLCSIVCCFASVVFIKLFYADLYFDVKDLLIPANIGQVFSFSAGVLMVIIMKFAEEKWQLYMNLIYAFIYFALVIPSIFLWHLKGAVLSIFIANIIRFIIVYIVGIFKLLKRKKEVFSQ